MIYKIRQKIFSLGGGSFTITDMNDTPFFQVKKQIMSLGDKLRIYDMEEQEVCYIEQKVFTFMPQYNIHMNGQQVASIKKQLNLLKNNFTINSAFGTYDVAGSIMAYEFNISQNGINRARISKQYFSFRDTYGVEVADNENHLLILAFAIVVDMILHQNNS